MIKLTFNSNPARRPPPMIATAIKSQINTINKNLRNFFTAILIFVSLETFQLKLK
jgi:hypothetical protein